MHPISTKVHGFLDYSVAILLCVSPWLFGFYDGSVASSVFIILGVAAILYSLITNYELGVSALIPFRWHLVLDTLNGLLLASSPWLFGFAERVWQPHLFIGLTELLVVLLTKRERGDKEHASVA